MKIKILLFLITLLFAVTKVNAQAHNMKPGWCKYAKNTKGSARDESASAECQVCKKENEKEKAVKAAEDKRRNDVAVAKGKADKAASDLANKKYQQERAEKNKVTEVFVTMPKSTAVKSNNPVKKGIVNSTDKAILKTNGSGRGFENEKNEPLFDNRTWRNAYTMENVSMTTNAPKNFGIVDVGSENNYDKKFRADVINSKGEYLFNDESIKFICHLNDGWLLVGCFNSDNYYVYNLFTKKKINFTSIAQLHSDFGRYIWGPALDFFLPIFSNKIELQKKSYAYQLQAASGSEQIKKNLIKFFPNQINEDILAKQSFVLVHTNQLATYLAYADNDYFEANLNRASTVLLYCVSKEGKLSTIKLK